MAPDDASGREPDGTLRWAALVAEAEDRLRRDGVAAAGAEARWLVERAGGFEPAEYLTGLDELVTERGMAFFDTMLQRRLAGEPIQYVLGQWAFRSLDLLVDRRVLIPRPETEVVAGLALVELAARTRPGRPLTAVDLGTGSGAIGLSMAAEHPGVSVWLTDVSAEALAVARANLAGLGREATRVRVVEGPWFEALPGELAGTVDVIVSNPPYIADGESLPEEVVAWEPAGALHSGPTGTEALDLLVDQAPRWLAADGVLVLELAPHQAVSVAQRARDRGFADVTVMADLARQDRAVVARRLPPGADGPPQR